MSNSVKPPPSRPTPGAWLTRQMERKGTSVRQIAEAMGVTGKTVYDWRDDRTAVSEARVPRLAEVLGISELDTRRGLGYWVPDGTEAPPATGAEELEAVEALLEKAMAELNRLKQRRSG